jgi:NAD dependent epimerase/dehydratase family enzyme
LDRLVTLVRSGLGGRVASGRQWVSWLHIDDWLAIARWSLGMDDVPTPPPSGVLLATAPHPVRNAELMAALRRVLHRPPAPPTPEPLLRLGAMLLRTDPALALTGRRAVSARLAEVGFPFRHPELGGALADLLA